MKLIVEDELALADPMAVTSTTTNSTVEASSNDSIQAATVAPTTNVMDLAASIASNAAAAIANVSATPMTPSRTPRKHSILTHTNPELLNTLNKMFSSPTANAPNSTLRARTPNRRASVAIGATSASAAATAAGANESNVADPNAPKEVKKSKSKLLKKLLGADEEEGSSGSASGLGLGLGLAATLPVGGLLGRPMSALAMAMGGGKGGAGGGMSFLEQIKARRAKEDVGATAEENPADALSKTITFPLPSSANENTTKGLGRPLNPFAAAASGGGAGGMSFLEQIKARRKNEE